MRSTLPILLLSGAILTAAGCSRDDRPAPGMPPPSDPAVTPAPNTTVPKVPEPRALDGPGARDLTASSPKGDVTAPQDATGEPKTGSAGSPQSAGSK